MRQNPAREPLRRQITVDGVRLSFLEWGAPNGEAPSLFCLHGLMATAESFAPIAAYLGPDRHMVAIDLPGNGSSGNSAGLDASFAGLAQLVRDFCAAAGLVRPVVVGHSHGGALALRMAVSDSQSLRGIVLLCPAHPFSGCETAVVRFYLSVAGRAFAHMIPWVPERLQRRGFEQMLGSSRRIDSMSFASYRRNLRRRGTVSHILRLLRSWEVDMEGLRRNLVHKPVQVPSLLIWGGEDRVVPPFTVARLQVWLPGSEVVSLPGIGHLPNEEAPERCARSIEDWLARLG